MSSELLESLKSHLKRGDLNSAAAVYLSLRKSLSPTDMAALRRSLPRENHIALLRKLYFQKNVENEKAHAENIRDDFLALHPNSEEQKNFESVIEAPEFFRQALDAFKVKTVVFDKKPSGEKSKDEIEYELKFMTLGVSALVDMEKRIGIKLTQLSEQEKFFSVEKLRLVFEGLQKEVIEKKKDFLTRRRVLLSAKSLVPAAIIPTTIPTKKVGERVMTIGFVRRYQLQRKLNNALNKGKIEKAATIDARFRDLVADETAEKRKEKSALFRAQLSRAHQLAILKVQYVWANQENDHERVAQLHESYMALNPVGHEKNDLTLSIRSSAFFRRKLSTIEKNMAMVPVATNGRTNEQINQDHAALTVLLESLLTMKQSVLEKKAEFEEQLNPQLKNQKKSPMVARLPVLSRTSGVAPVKANIAKLTKLEEDIDAKIARCIERCGILERVQKGRVNAAQREVEAIEKERAFTVSDEVKKLFQGALGAFPKKRRLNIFSKSKFDCGLLITKLQDMNNSLVKGLKTHAASGEKPTADYAAVFMQALLHLFRQYSKEELNKMMQLFDNTSFKNFRGSLNYYLSKRTAEDAELAAVAKLQYFSDYFVEACVQVVGEKNNTDVKDRFSKRIVSEDDVHKDSSAFITGYTRMNVEFDRVSLTYKDAQPVKLRDEEAELAEDKVFTRIEL